MRRLLALLGLVVVGCSHDDGCLVDVQCSRPFRLEILPASGGTLPRERYTVNIEMQGPDAAGTCSLASGCDEALTRAGVELGQALSDPSSVSIEIRQPVVVVSVRIERDGAEVGKRTLRPVYETTTSEAVCGPLTCTTAPRFTMRVI